VQALEIAQAVYQNLRKPSQQKLAWKTLLRAMSDCQRRILREAQLSDRGWLETYVDVYPASRDEVVTATNFSIPTRVEWRSLTASETDDWNPVSIVANDGFSQSEEIAFYGSPARMNFSASVGDLKSRVYRVWYETAPAALTESTADLAVASIFTDLLTDETTLYCLPLVMDDSESWLKFVGMQGVTVRERLKETKEQFKKWLNMSRDNGIVYGEGFNSRSYDADVYMDDSGMLRAG
jgi:hypothetical protein